MDDNGIRLSIGFNPGHGGLLSIRIKAEGSATSRNALDSATIRAFDGIMVRNSETAFSIHDS